MLSWGFWVGAGPRAAGLLGGEGLEGGAGAPFWLLDDSMTSAGLLEPEILMVPDFRHSPQILSDVCSLRVGGIP